MNNFSKTFHFFHVNSQNMLSKYANNLVLTKMSDKPETTEYKIGTGF